MDNNQLINRIIAFTKVVKIPQELKDKILSRLPTSTGKQLEEVYSVVLQQVIMDIYFDEYQKFEKSEDLLDESDLDGMYNTIVKRMDDTYSLVLTEAELNQIRTSLQNIKQSNVSTVGNPTSPAPAAVSAPPIQPVAPTPIAPVVPVQTAPVSPVPPEV